jgi:hypothetical protein
MSTYQQNTDGSWGPARPLPTSRLYRIEQWMRRRGHRRLADLIARYDERGLAR